MLTNKPNLFYHTIHKMALSYKSPCNLKKAQKAQNCLYGNTLLKKHVPLTISDSEETLQLADEKPNALIRLFNQKCIFLGLLLKSMRKRI